MRSLLRPLILVLAVLCLPAAGFAVDLVVTRYDDPVPGGCDNLGPHETWDCSLREAVIASVALPTDDRILLSAGTYELTRAGADEDDGLTGDLDVLGNLEILGPGATMTVIDARTFTIPIQIPLFVTITAFIAYPLQALLPVRAIHSQTWPIQAVCWKGFAIAAGGMTGIVLSSLMISLPESPSAL